MGLFSKGKADLIISKSNFYPGETITGVATLAVDKPALANKFSVSLIGEKKVTVRRRSSNGNYTTETETTRIYDFKQPLDGQREYCGATQYNFAIRIPQDILAGLQNPGGGGGLFHFVQGNAPRYVWYVQAMLDIPKSLDVNKKFDITIDWGAPPPNYAQPVAGWAAPRGYPPPPYPAYPPPPAQNYPPPPQVPTPVQGYPAPPQAQNYPPSVPAQGYEGPPATGNPAPTLSPGACPSCGQPAAPGHAWCGNCGKPLPPPAPPAGYCPSCRQANDPAARFCVACGTPLK
jgi:hypothetical protein